MCGLVASFSYDVDSPRISMDDLDHFRDALAHRGPDAAGSWMSPDGDVGLGHRRLTIIDLTENGNQPLGIEDGRYRIVFNGEIYNYQDLRVELEKSGVIFRTRTDTEVILQLYATGGVENLSRLRGMYAFAIWDSLRQGILLARDGFGIKPLYYSDIDGRLAVSSEFRALHKFLGKNLPSDPMGHLGYLFLGWVPEPVTPVKGINILSAGTWLWRDKNGASQGTLFDAVELTVNATNCPISDSSISRESVLQDALDGSVRDHLVADVPISLFLSSGVDSNLISMMASRHANYGLQTITLGADLFRNTENDEVGEAANAAQELGLPHESHWLSYDDFENNLEAFLNSMDMPTIDGLNTYLISSFAAKCGAKVVLSGLGGDEMFGGYPSFNQIPKITSIGRSFSAAPFLGKKIRKLIAPVISCCTSPKYASLLEMSGCYTDAYLLRRALFLPWELMGKAPELEISDAWERMTSELVPQEVNGGSLSPHSRISLLESTLYMRGQLLRDADWAGMAHGLEIRTPLVDSVLFSEILDIQVGSQPYDKKEIGSLFGGAIAWAANRKKTGFGLPIHEWINQHSGISDRGHRGWAGFVYKEWCQRNGVS